MLTESPTTVGSDLRIENAALNADEYRQRKVVLRSRPTMVYVELTQNCNLSCLMCRSANSFDKSKNMTSELFARVMSDLAATALWIDLRGWGESTILPDFTARLRTAAESGARIRLVTNGLLMDAQRFELVCGSDGAVAVSVDAATPDLFAQLGRGDLNRVLTNVRVGTTVAQRLGRGEVYFNTVVSHHTVPELCQLVETAAATGVHKIVLSPIKTWPGHAAGLESDAAMLREFLSTAAARAQELGVVLQLGASLHPDHVIKEALPATCASPWSHALIDYRGELIFCDHLINRPEYSMGSINGADFEAVWNGARFQALRQAHVDAERSRNVGNAYSKCNWCYANRYQDSEAPPMEGEDRREVSTRAPGVRRLA